MPEVKIERLGLTVPGLGQAEARGFAQEVAERLAADLPVGERGRRLGALDVRITPPSGLPRDELAAYVARRIRESLG